MTARSRWWQIAYCTALDPIKARVAMVAITFGYAGLVVPILAVALPHPGIHFRWWAFWVIVAVACVEGAVMALDLRRLIGHDFGQTIPAWKVLAQVLAAVGAAGIADYAGGSRGIFGVLIVLPVLIASVVGNWPFIGVVWLASMTMLGVSSAAGGIHLGALPLVLAVYGSSSLGASAMYCNIRDAHLRSSDRFDRMAQTTEVILRTEGVDEAMGSFLPLVGGLTEVERVTAYRSGPTGMVLLATWPDDAKPTVGTPDRPPEGAPDMALLGGDTPYTIADKATVLRAWTGDGQALAVVAERARPAWWNEVSYESSVRQLAIELGLLVHHNQFLVQLDALARTDALTGLANRRELMGRLEREQARALRQGAPLSVAMIDLDLFKEYNDAFGHLEGDAVLANIGAALAERARDTDVVARYGGEEFCVVLPDTDLAGATALTTELACRVRHVPANRVVTCSAGVAQWTAGQSADDVLRIADDALYRAKAAGRDQVVMAGCPRPTTRVPRLGP